jgi:hypothetical protein
MSKINTPSPENLIPDECFPDESLLDVSIGESITKSQEKIERGDSRKTMKGKNSCTDEVVD